MSLTRRTFVGGSLAAGLFVPLVRGAEPLSKLPVAGVATTYGPNNHADVILSKICLLYTSPSPRDS